MEILFFVALVAALYFWWQARRRTRDIAEREVRIAQLQSEVEALAQYRQILDAEAKAMEIVAVAQGELDNARNAADAERAAAKREAADKIGQAENRLRASAEEARLVIEAAKKRAEEIAGDAYKALENAKQYEKTAQALRNIVEGYGDRYVVPTYSLLDELAEEFGHTEAGEQLKTARDRTRQMVKDGRAATCDYAETNRRVTAVRFVTDAFNGKVDSILSRSKADNVGTLEQHIRDAFAVVNHNGAAFRNARINPEYLESRLAELKWAVVTRELREQEREEQRRIKEQIREEERARREFEKAMRDAAKEEEMLKKAMEKVQQQVAAASEAQKAQYEVKLQELAEKLRTAEEKSQRALSMAQQTRAGHVYVISNIGSFGEEVFKIGMTRRLEPKDRIRELGDASVPFEFDIHAMIYNEDAPTLERALHKRFLRMQINKVNPRKEFFRLSLKDIRDEIEKMDIAAHWTMAAEAREYRECVAIEHALAENPQAQAEWTRHQMELDPLEGAVEEPEEV
jgi:hypothetical protein